MKSSIFVLWIIAYVVLLVLPLCTNLVEYTLFSRRLSEQISERNMLALDAIRNTVDNQLFFVETLSINMSLNRDIREIVNKITLPLEADDKLRLYHFVTNFEYMFGMENYTDRVFIYFKDIDLVAKSGATQSLDSFYNTHFTGGNWDRETWRGFVESRHSGDYFVMNFDKREDEIFYIKTIPISYSDTVVNLILNFNMEDLTATLQELYLSESGQLNILDQDGNAILQIGDISADGVNKLNRDSRGVLSYESKSEANNWRYIYLLPEKTVYQKINQTKTVIVFVMLGGFLVCLCLAVQFFKFNYKEIKRLMNFFSKDNKNREGSKINEYSFLSEKVEGSLKEKERLSAEISNQNRWFKENVLTALLEGKEINSEYKKQELDMLGLDFKAGSFLVALYSAEQSGGDEAASRSFIVDNIFAQLLHSQSYTFQSIVYENCMVYMIHLKEGQGQENIMDSFRFVHDFISEYFHFAFYGAAGDAHSGQEGIAAGYTEAKKTLEYGHAHKKAEVWEYSLIKDRLFQNYFYSQKMEEQLIGLIKANETDKLHTVLEEIFERNQTDGELSLNSARYLVVNLFNTVKKFMLLYGVVAEEAFPEECKLINNIFKHESVEDMKTTIDSIFEACYERTMYKLKTKEELADKIILFIRQNYSDQEMGIQMIADAFSLSRDYTARKFKEKTQIRLNDYINIVRIEKAKEYLSETNHLISGIAEQVGFSNYRTFVRIFTNVTGISPKQYRIINEKKNGGDEA